MPGRCGCASRASTSSGRGAPTMMYLSGGPGGAGVLEMIDVMLTVPSLLPLHA